MTSRSFEERLHSVRAVVRAARDVVEVRESFLDALVASTGLSIEGVRLAIDRHLELHPTEEELTELVRVTPEADEVTVVLSSNVFVAALRALAIACAAAPRVTVRPSRREPVFPRLLVDAFRPFGDGSMVLAAELDVASVQRGEIHVYGRDETIADVRARAAAGVRVRGHGSGMGIAWIRRNADMSSAGEWLADDVVVFDQRGCLSPRLVFVEGDDDDAARFAAFAHDALGRAADRVPRGALTPGERSEVRRWITTMEYAGQVLEGREHAVAVLPSRGTLDLPPPGRHLVVCGSRSIDDVQARTSPFAKAIVNVGSDDEEQARLVAPAWARISRLGAMQRPPLDGPVDRRPNHPNL